MADEKPTEEKKFDEKTLFLEKTEEMVKRHEKAVEEMRALVERNEELAARKLLGGSSDAGIQPEKPKEESPKEYKDRIMRGELHKK